MPPGCGLCGLFVPPFFFIGGVSMPPASRCVCSAAAHRAAEQSLRRPTRKPIAMGCLFLIFAGLFPRLGVLLIWLARPELFLTAFGGFWLWPLLGIIFLPMTTLMYCLVWNPVGGIGGFDWFWLFLALMIDLGGALSSGYANRDRVPGYSAA
jgi:hypothetical protein